MADPAPASGLERAMGGKPAPGDAYAPAAVLVTGGAGFIASHFVIRYVKAHPDVKVWGWGSLGAGGRRGAGARAGARARGARAALRARAPAPHRR